MNLEFVNTVICKGLMPPHYQFTEDQNLLIFK